MQLSFHPTRCFPMSVSWLGKIAVFAGMIVSVATVKSAPAQADWQWSVPVENGFAFLWIPPGCEHVRAVMFGQHNMLEEGIMEHPAMLGFTLRGTEQ